MSEKLARQNRARNGLTSVLLDEFVNAGVLRHIGNGVGQHAVNRIGNFGVGGIKSAFNIVACAVVFGHLVAICCGSDDGDIRFGGDAVTHVALGKRRHTVG